MTLPPRFPTPVRPDLADRLLAAVAERDLPMADRLVQQWVHRRGLAALEALIAGPLRASQGVEAAQWLQERAAGSPLAGVPLEQGGSIRAAAAEPVPVAEALPVAEVVPAAVLSPSWPALAVVPDGEPAPVPGALAPLRAWLPDAHLLPLAS